jgi:hypothetical protein
MTRGHVNCAVCGQAIEAHWMLWLHLDCQAAAPEPTPTAEDVQRKANRLAWELKKLENRWQQRAWRRGRR